MKNFTLTAVSTAICASLTVSVAAPSFAQQTPTTTTPATKTAPAGNNAQPPSIEQLKLTKEQQAKLVELQKSVMKKKIAVLTPTQRQQVQAAMQQGKSPNLTLTPAQQSQLKAIQTAAIAQQDAILTSEQKLKLQEINKQNSVPQQR
jgi:Spy/CpxP family protein refolding chaperone